MAELPSGLVTFVFTDIEGSTRLFRRLGQSYPPLLERHNELLRRAWAAHGGVEVKTEGDAFLVAFASAADALRACVEAQRRLGAERWPHGAEVGVRMGVHTGLAAPKDDDYVAFALHQAARVVGTAHGGQIVVSPDTRDAGAELPEISLRPLGRYRLRDFDEPVELHQVVADGLGDSFPAVRAIPAEGHNLQKPRSTLLGREADLAGVGSLLSAGSLVSIVGPGGVGKTRLAREVGLRATDQWPGGVWMAELAQLASPGLLASAVADALGTSRSGSEPVDAVIDQLRDASALIVLDNCEHVLDAAASFVGSVLAACSSVGVLATSREALGVEDELVWRLEPLTDAAVDLFLDRAAALNPRGPVLGSDLPAVSQICARLDGMPLAIELAAARTDRLSLREILAGLDDQACVLRSRRRDLDPRQQSLEAALDWSYDLLDEIERAVFRRTGIFADSFSREAAEAAAGWGQLDRSDVAEAVWTLVDKSLLVPDISEGETRYGLLEPIRVYARRRCELEADLEQTAVETARWLLDGAGPRAVTDAAWLHAARVEADNVRTLIGVLAAKEPITAQRLACSIALLHHAESTYRDGAREIEELLAILPAPSRERLSLLSLLGLVQGSLGVPISAEVLVEADELVAGGLVEPAWSRGRFGMMQAIDAYRSGEVGFVIALAERALARPMLPLERARWCNTLGLMNLDERRFDQAATCFADALDLQERGGDVHTTDTWSGLAEARYGAGLLGDAARAQLQALELGVQLGLRLPVAFASAMAARMCWRDGLWSTAVLLHSAAEETYEAVGFAQMDLDAEQSRRLLESGRRALGDEEFDDLVQEGRRLDLITQIESARSVLEAVATGNSIPAPESLRDCVELLRH